MVKFNIAGGWLFLDGILIVLLGFIHLGFAPNVYSNISSKLELATALAMTYMFVAAGLSLLLAGWIVIINSFKFAGRDRSARTMVIAVGVYILLAGIGAVIAMPANVFSFILLGLAVLEILPIIIFWIPMWQTPNDSPSGQGVKL